jgi:hypothetical protein
MGVYGRKLTIKGEEVGCGPRAWDRRWREGSTESAEGEAGEDESEVSGSGLGESKLAE